MNRTIVVCGYGTGISAAVAERFGHEGFSVALVARSAERLAHGVARLEGLGIRAAGFPADLADETQVRRMIENVRADLGPITVLHWNAYAGGAGDLTEADSAAVRSLLELPLVGLLVALQAALPDLSSQPGGAVLVTNGGLGLNDPDIDAMAVTLNAMGLAVANAAKHKLVGVLAPKLKAMNVYAGEVMVLSPVKGTAWDDGTATLEPSTVAEAFHELFASRTDVSKHVG